VSEPLLLANLGQLLTLAGDAGPRRGPAMRELGLVKDAAVLCAGGRIVSVGRTRDALRDPWLRRNRRQITEIDCGGRVALPGFVDAHTHPAFVAPRLVDFEQRIAGANYAEIAKLGGGIRSSMALVRKVPRAQIAERILATLREMAAHGTTTVEAKSGYGLSAAAEIKSLEAIRDAAQRWPGTVVSTLLAAHVVPPEHEDDRAACVEGCENMAALAARRGLATFVDVFIERGAFSAKEAERLFRHATEQGLGVRVHVGQFSASKRGWLPRVVRRFAIASLDHLDHLDAADLKELVALAKSGAAPVATLVPASNYFLGTGQYPAARKLIDAGLPVALATDFNPGTAPTTSMPFVLSLACTQMRMFPAEAVTAATINGAHSLRLAQRKGSIERGKDADVAVFDVRDWREVPYWFGANRCWQTVVGGVALPGPV